MLASLRQTAPCVPAGQELRGQRRFLARCRVATAQLSQGRRQRGGGDDPHGWDREQWAAGYVSLAEEALDYEVVDIEGVVPAELSGTYFRNGPATFEAGTELFAHPFDGDGLMTALELHGGRALLRSRFVDTPERRAEKAAGRILYRNTFGTQRRGGAAANALDVNQKNVSNTNVLFWAGRLWSLWEALQPYRLDARTLETLGIDTLDGTLHEGLPFGTGLGPVDELLRAARTGLGGDAFSAHPHVEGATGKLVTFSYAIRLALPPVGPLQTVITLLEFEPGSVVPSSRREIPLQGYGFCHDFCFTDTHAIFFQSPVDLDLVPFVTGQRCPGECLRFDATRPTLAFVVPRHDAAAPVRVYQLPPAFVFHHANAAAATDGSGDIIVDSVHLEGLALGMSPDGDFRDVDFEGVYPYRLFRTRLPTAPGGKEASTAQVSPRIVEFPSVAPSRFGRPARYVYCACVTHPTRVQPLQSWLKLDMDDAAGLARGDVASTVWHPGRHCFVGEPQFVAAASPRSEDDGYLMGWIFDGERKVAAFAILDARSMTQVAMLRLKHAVPYGLHGTWVPGLTDDA